MIFLFIQLVFLEPLLGAEDTGRNKTEKFLLLWGSQSRGETDDKPDE